MMKIKPVQLLFVILCLFLSSAFPKIQQTEFETDQIKRLIDLCKLWGQVKYFHPFLAYRKNINWDKALIDAIPKIKKAKNSLEYQSALQSMLDVLNDPLTKVSSAKTGESKTNKKQNKTLTHKLTNDGILIVTINDYFALSMPESQKNLKEITKKLSNARAIIFDLRSDEPIGDFGNVLFNIYFGQIERLINSQPLSTAGERRRVYYGYENFSPSASGQYKTGFLIENNSQLFPLKNARDIPSIFILNKNSGVFKSTTALQKHGKSLIVFEGKNVSIGKTKVLRLSENLSAQIRVSEAIFEDGTDGSLQADLFADKNLIARSLKLARNFAASKIKRKSLPMTSSSRKESSYPRMRYPPLEYRLLSAFRIWSVINYFFPYKHLMDKDWNQVLEEFIPKFEKARNELEYTLTVAEMVTYIQDSHAYLNSPVYNEFTGTGYPPIRIRWIENKPVVTAFRDEKTTMMAGVEIGDIVLTVDGEDAISRLKRYAKYISASTFQSKMDKASLSFMNGKPNSFVKIKFQGRNDKEKLITLKRKYEDFTTLYHRERRGEILRLLPGNIGYADLDRLTLNMLDEMFEKFKGTKAIIFDMRGYPYGTAWAIAPRLSNKQQKAALFETPLVGHNLPEEDSFVKFFQKIRPTPKEKWIYKGNTIMLIDERAASQAEHTGLLFRAANKTLFIGSHTTGVNGEITTFTVPGAITIGFTGQSVKFPDGKQLQRIGLVPDIEIKPTIEGIREKRDEVLEKAIQYVNQ